MAACAWFIPTGSKSALALRCFQAIFVVLSFDCLAPGRSRRAGLRAVGSAVAVGRRNGSGLGWWGAALSTPQPPESVAAGQRLQSLAPPATIDPPSDELGYENVSRRGRETAKSLTQNELSDFSIVYPSGCETRRGHKMWTETAQQQYRRDGLRYASDVTDEEWALIEALLPPPRRLGRPRTTEMREVVNAMLYMLTTGCQWRWLPKEFPPFSTVQRFFYRWRDAGLWQTINHSLVMRARGERP